MNIISTPQCLHFKNCSGCEISLNETPLVWNSALLFFKQYSVVPEMNISNCCEWRMKAKLAVQGTFENPKIGLYKKGTHEAFSIPHCLVHHPSINRAVLIVKEALAFAKL